jgi:putative SOS response-associated peptidase YedK
VCNLYSLTPKQNLIAQFFRVSHNRAVAFDPLPGIFPRYMAPVVRSASDGDREMVMMSWGFMLLQQGRAPKPVTNVRDDKLRTGFWRESFERRRCLVPAGAFCEPNGDVKPATWHWFAIKGESPRPLFAFPGIWRRYRGPVKKDGPNVDIDTYAFMTTTPNPLVATINHERMPVLLTREDEFETWLHGPPDAAFALAREYPAEKMQIVREGLDKEDMLPAA